MSYRKEWRLCKSYFPNVYAHPMSDGFRISRDRNDPRMRMEFYSLGQGRTREEAWKSAAQQAKNVYEYLKQSSPTTP